MGTWCALKVNVKKLGEMKTNAAEFSKKVGDIVYNNKCSILVTRIFLIGDDIDIYNFKDIIWALSARSRPGLDDFVFEDVRGLPIVPYMSQGTGHPKRGGKIITNCLLPAEYNDGVRSWVEVSYKDSYPDDVKQKVDKLWETTDIGK